MFSNFGNIFITRPRHAETTDTRLGIRHHDPEQEGRKKKDRDAEPVSVFETNDSATVTVDALRAFLENFLKTLEAEKNSAKNSNANTTISVETGATQNPGTHPHVDSRAAHAANAYQHAAKKLDRTAVPEISQDAAAPLLGSADVRQIYVMIEDLKILSARNIEYLIIERSDSFLGSLVAAVEKAKNL